MSNCAEIKPILVCFTPLSGDPVTLLEHVIYDYAVTPPEAVGNFYTTADDVEVKLDLATYLGGGTIEAGECGLYIDCGGDSDLPTTDSAEFFAVSARSAGFAPSWGQAGNGQDLSGLLGGGQVAAIGNLGGEVFFDTSSIPECAVLTRLAVRLGGSGGSGTTFGLFNPIANTYVTATNTNNIANLGWVGNNRVVGTRFAVSFDNALGYEVIPEEGTTNTPTPNGYYTAVLELDPSAISVADLANAGVKFDYTNSGEIVGDITLIAEWDNSACVGEPLKSTLVTDCATIVKTVSDCAGNESDIIGKNVFVNGVVDVRVCPEPEQEICVVEYRLGCDDINGDGSVIIQYLTGIQTCSLGTAITSQTNIGDFDDQLNPYIPINPVTCDPSTLDFDEEIFCDNGNGTSFIRRTVVVAGTGAIVEEVEIDGLTPYVVTGAISQGSCNVDYRLEKLCEIDDTKLLLIDSGGNFAEHSFINGDLTAIPIPVPSAGAAADIPNFLLHAFTASNILTVNVNTKVVVNTVPTFTNDGSPLTFSAASFYNGMLYGFASNNLYRADVNTGETSFVAGPYTGIVGSGESLAINPLDGKFYKLGSAGRVYEIDPTGTSLAATLVYDSISEGNGATFDTKGVLYLGSSAGDSTNYGEVYAIPNFPSAGGEYTVIEDWQYGVNSLVYYEIEAQQPSCFFRKYAVDGNGNLTTISDHFVSDFSERLVAGAVICCESGCCSDSGGETSPSGVQLTPNRLVTTSDGSTIAGIYSFTIHNHDNAIIATVGGQPLPAGETISFGVDYPNTLASIAYVTNGAELHINWIS